MPFHIVRQDITKLRADAIVNAANCELQMGGGVCGAIFHAAGAAQLQAACRELAPVQTGEAVITPAFALAAKWIIHAVGPIYRQWSREENEFYLRAAYTNSLKRAIENDCESIAFPLISSGIYGYPKDEALHVAQSAIRDFLAEHDLDITLTVFDTTAFRFSREHFAAVEDYIGEHYVEEKPDRFSLTAMEERIFGSTVGGDLEETPDFAGTFSNLSLEAPHFSAPRLPNAKPLDELFAGLDEPFSHFLLRLIASKGKTEVEVYKAANLDRKLFSKIRSGKAYMPGKRTVVALAVALELPLDETEEFLRRAGYALSHSVKFDVIVEYFISKGVYDIFEINELLFSYDQPLLGS